MQSFGLTLTRFYYQPGPSQSPPAPYKIWHANGIPRSCSGSIGWHHLPDQWLRQYSKRKERAIELIRIISMTFHFLTFIFLLHLEKFSKKLLFNWVNVFMWSVGPTGNFFSAYWYRCEASCSRFLRYSVLPSSSNLFRSSSLRREDSKSIAHIRLEKHYLQYLWFSISHFPSSRSQLSALLQKYRNNLDVSASYCSVQRPHSIKIDVLHDRSSFDKQLS